MKYLVIILFCFCLASNAKAQTLFTYGKDETTATEFLRAYNKNKPTPVDKEKSMREYLDLYINFKLKVKAAEEIRLDTISQIKFDVQNFRNQIVDNYMNDEQGLQRLIDEAADRSTKDIHTIYFIVPVATDAKPADTLKAMSAANALYNSLQLNSRGFDEIISEVSSKYAPCKYADIGFVTAFSLPYNFENILYTTPIGEVSKPYRNSKGWVILKPTEARPAMGKWKVAQLLFAYPPDADIKVKLSVKNRADSIYKLLKAGLSFTEAAKQFSDDRANYLSGGLLQEFGTGTYQNPFEANVISLKKDNDISQPFETNFGYHIIKRIAVTSIPKDKNDAGFQFELKQKIGQDERINNEREKFAEQITKITGYKKTTNGILNELLLVADSVLKGKNENSWNKSFSTKTIATFFDGNKIKGQDWITYLKEEKASEGFPKYTNAKLLVNFDKQNIVTYYKANLEKYNAEFKNQMQEFKEGNMLFEMMERSVWSKAGADTINLKNYYASHSNNYKWAESADIIVFNSSDKIKLTEAYTELKQGGNWQSIVQKSNNILQADSGRYELSQIQNTAQKVAPKAGEFSDITSNSNDAGFSFVKYIRFYAANMQRSFIEAKGLVINDYQNIIEQQWITELKKKYPVKINEVVFKQLLTK